MSKSNMIPADILARMNQSILELPHKPPKSQTEAMEYMAPAFRQALNRGYSLEDIQAHIKKEFGLTLQMSKMKRAITPEENAQADTVAKPKKARTPKLTDTPTQPDQKEVEKTLPTPDAQDTLQNGDSGPDKTGENLAVSTTEKGSELPPVLAGTPVLHKERINLSCKKEEQELAKKLGAHWDNDKNLCYIPPQTDLRPFEKLLPKPLTSYAQK